jgi:hypothetical protein
VIWVLARLSAVVLVALILSPFTAPFQTFELGPQDHHGRTGDAVATCASDDEAASIVTQPITFSRWKLVRLADPSLGAKIGSALAPRVAAPRVLSEAPRASSRSLSAVLRL